MKRYNLLILSLVLVFASCDLEREPYGIANFWKTETDAQLGLNAAYAPLYEEEGYGEGHFWAGGASDDMITYPNEGTANAVCEFRSATNDSWGMYDNWQFMYRTIRRASDVIKNVPGIQMNESSKNRILGEANFLCGHTYFFLAKRYGGLPFYDNTKPEEINKPRETKAETYRRIEAYLLKSIEYYEKEGLWQRNDDDLGRPNLGAAYGLLAKVYAHWGKFQECKTACEKVIGSGKYQLDTNNNNGFADLFSPAGEKNTEVLFNLVNTPVRHKGTVTSVILLPSGLSGGTGWNGFAPTKSLYDAFEAGDLRKYVTVVGPGDEVNYLGVNTVITADDLTNMQTGFACNKYAAGYNDMTEFNWETGADIPLLRYSDVLLLHAEAIMQLAGAGPNNPNVGVAAAAESFNKVRVRAFGNNVAKAIAAPTFNDLVKERRCELAYEDDRHFDLVRWGMAQSIYNSATTATDPRGARNFVAGKHDHLPLPQREIDNSNGVLINNPSPGYSSF